GSKNPSIPTAARPPARARTLALAAFPPPPSTLSTAPDVENTHGSMGKPWETCGEHAKHTPTPRDCG
ncbi:MAG: hypothetical protein RSE23_13150, partial [Clostridia bacterium]